MGGKLFTDKLVFGWLEGFGAWSLDSATRVTSAYPAHASGSSVTNLAYDYESRLTALSGAQTASYAYNALDTRVSKIEGGTTTDFVRDGVGVTAPVIRDTFASYTPGVSERRGSTSTFSHSGLKNAEMQTSSSSTVVATNRYDAFGNNLASTGTWSGAFGYAGDFGYQEDASGLKLLGHRYYDSSTGRFLTRDPARDGRNWYAYCGSNPLLNCDPNGLRAVVGTFGGNLIVPLFAGNVTIAIGKDVDSGHWGMYTEVGLGVGAGLDAGVGPGAEWDNGMSFNQPPGGPTTTSGWGKWEGNAQLWLLTATVVDKDDWAVGVSPSPGIGFAGTRKYQHIIDITASLAFIEEGLNNFVDYVGGKLRDLANWRPISILPDLPLWGG